MIFLDVLLILLVTSTAFLAGFGLRGFLGGGQEPEWAPSQSTAKRYEPPSRRIDMP